MITEHQFQFFKAHTPDNTFIGFVVENDEFSKAKLQKSKENITIVYGKQDKFWAVSFLYAFSFFKQNKRY